MTRCAAPGERPASLLAIRALNRPRSISWHEASCESFVSWSIGCHSEELGPRGKCRAGQKGTGPLNAKGPVPSCPHHPSPQREIDLFIPPRFDYPPSETEAPRDVRVSSSTGAAGDARSSLLMLTP